MLKNRKFLYVVNILAKINIPLLILLATIVLDPGPPFN